MSNSAEIDDYNDNCRYTYADYLEWEGPQRYQLFNGEAFQMASPSVEHQAISLEVSNQFYNFLKGKPCRVFTAPLDVRLFPKKDKSDNTVVQPDILVVCDKNKIDENSINGAPDLVIEIASQSNDCYEQLLKFQYYLKAGVREYWDIVPEQKNVQVHLYEKDRYITALYEANERVPVTVLPGLEIALEDLFKKNE